MQNVLLVTSSPRGEVSHSTHVATELARGFGGDLTVRELWRDPPTPIGPEFVHAIFTSVADRTPQQRALLQTSDEAIGEILAADVIVIAAAMINLGMPASLKTWIDFITRSGVTFRYSEAGPVGLIRGKRVVLVLASGGVYTSGPGAAINFLEPPLRTSLDFVGLTGAETVWIEGLAFGEDATQLALTQARDRVRGIVAEIGANVGVRA
jgi:FMN-dependent NADH-azoreductase